ncbi:hypothetical protein BHE74_00052787, partial [Ensete ventricosum]
MVLVGEKLKRATFMPALRSRSIISTDLEAGPRVHTIFVFGHRTAAIPHSHTKARARLETATQNHEVEEEEEKRRRL